MAAEGGGSGVFTFASGSKYTGEYQIQDERRVRHGRGKYVDGPETFEGQWADDKMNGTGTYSFASGAVYEGEFKENKFHGEGTYKWDDGATYKGMWRENKMHGKGCYIDPEEVKWEGQFYNGKFNNGRAFVSLR